MNIRLTRAYKLTETYIDIITFMCCTNIANSFTLSCKCNVSSLPQAAYMAYSLLGSRYTTALFGATLAVSRYILYHA